MPGSTTRRSRLLRAGDERSKVTRTMSSLACSAACGWRRWPTDGRVVQARIPLALSCAPWCSSPSTTSPTSHARGVLPSSVPLADALFNVARSSLLVAALAAGPGRRAGRSDPRPTASALSVAAVSRWRYASGDGACRPARWAPLPLEPDQLCWRCVPPSCRRTAVGSCVCWPTARTLGEPGQVLQLSLIDQGAHVVD